MQSPEAGIGAREARPAPDLPDLGQAPLDGSRLDGDFGGLPCTSY